MLEDSDSFITAREFASRLGCPLRTRSGSLTNHLSFLQRVQERHSENFPPVRWLGSRKVYRAGDVAAFIASVPTQKPEAA